MFQNIIEVLILSAIQGISEFLPISSSAHLILVSSLYEFKSSSLLIDISLHLGSLFAIIYFFRRELLDIKNNQRILGLITLGSILLLHFFLNLKKTEFAAATLICWPIILLHSEKKISFLDVIIVSEGLS